MHLIVGNRPTETSGEVRFFRTMAVQGILGDLDDGGVQFDPPGTPKPDRADDREPGTRKDGEAMPPDSLDPKADEDQPSDVDAAEDERTTP